MFVMKWSDRKQSLNDPSKHGKFVAIDDSSGGYPYPVDNFESAHVHKTIDEARKYQRMFPCLDIFAVRMTLQPVK